MYDLLVTNARIRTLLPEQESATTLAVRDGRVAALDAPEDAPAAARLDAGGKLLLPGFVDCHTHAVYAGNRMHESALKLRGASYEEIARAGGGILSTVQAVREASEAELARQSLPRLEALRREGVTSIEIKSGYGLSTRDELKMLRAIARLRAELRMDIHATFLGAHAIPKDRDREEYLREILDEMLPAVAGEKLAEAVDIFVENIAFTVDEQRRLFDRARELGFRLRAHTDQLSNLGATKLAAEYGATSCDHLEYMTGEDARAMAEHGTIAVLLPGAFYCLRETRLPPVDLLREHGVPMAIATDVNPGSSPVASLLACMHMAATFFRLTPEEVLAGVTVNAARALGAADTIGALAPGRPANFSLWDLPSPEFFTYQLGGIAPAAVYYEGIPA